MKSLSGQFVQKINLDLFQSVTFNVQLLYKTLDGILSAIERAFVGVKGHAELVELTGLVCEKPAWLDSLMPALILNQRSQNSCCFVFCYVGRAGGIRAGRLSRGLFTTMEMR